MARAIHFTGCALRRRSFVECSALTPTLVESELSGHVNGVCVSAKMAGRAARCGFSLLLHCPERKRSRSAGAGAIVEVAEICLEDNLRIRENVLTTQLLKQLP